MQPTPLSCFQETPNLVSAFAWSSEINHLVIASDDVSKVLKASGVEVEAEKLELLVKNLKGKQLHELIEAGSSKISSVAAAGGAGPAATTGDAAPVEEEKPKEKEEEGDVEMGGLFGDDDDYWSR